MKRILWLSQHHPIAKQLERLRTRFGSDVQVDVDTDTFTNAEELVRRFTSGGYDDWIVVAPLSVIGRMCELAQDLNLPKPLMANMEQLHGAAKAQADLNFRGRAYRFVGFRRVKRLALEYDEEF